MMFEKLRKALGMAKMFYSMNETERALGMDEQHVRKLVGAGLLREFRDGPRIMFKTDQVDALVNEPHYFDDPQPVLLPEPMIKPMPASPPDPNDPVTAETTQLKQKLAEVNEGIKQLRARGIVVKCMCGEIPDALFGMEISRKVVY